MKNKTYSKYTKAAAFLLGQQIKHERKKREWTEQELADKAGISRATLQKIEAGEMSTSIGLVFETATRVGVSLFNQDHLCLATNIQLIQNKIDLLPKRIRKIKKVKSESCIDNLKAT